MKKLLVLLLVALLVGCAKDKEEDLPTFTPAEKEFLQIITGKFVGSHYSSSINTTQTEEITFTPYADPREVVSIIDGKVRTVGTAIVVKYTDNHLLETKTNCYYSNDFKEGLSVTEPTISFYSYSDNGEINNKEDKRIIIVSSSTEDKFFEMRPYGTTAENNVKYERK